MKKFSGVPRDASSLSVFQGRIETVRHATKLNESYFGEMLGVAYDRSRGGDFALNLTVAQLLHLREHYFISPSWFVEGVRGLGQPPGGDISLSALDMSETLRRILFVAGCDTVNDVQRYMKTRGEKSLMAIAGCDGWLLRELRHVLAEDESDLIPEMTEKQREYFQDMTDHIEVVGPEVDRNEVDAEVEALGLRPWPVPVSASGAPSRASPCRGDRRRLPRDGVRPRGRVRG